ncbi:uncharacterized protein [Antedon mediterranea]|uniref:uncharacterized protein n=1 Tax=Antedon mediterranea TaxID=105859 RepID=UPI003AF7B740
MGGGCTKASSLPVDDNVKRWRGHVLYDNGLESDEDGELLRKSSSRRRLSAEIKAMYTSNAKRHEITILHFNDVYNIEQRDVEPVGGAARFATMIRKYMHLHPAVFFSGDALNPSLMSSMTRGTQMIPILNAMHIKAAVYGNHDFDFGIDELEDITKDTEFPWLLSNVIDNFTGRPLADGVVSEILYWRGTKLGLMGLVEEEWLVTLATIDRENLTYIDFVTKAKELCIELKEQGAEFIIALTHMRMPNDIRLAEEVDSIDLILGGHDHDYEVKLVNNKYIVKSGTEFRQLTKVNISFYELPEVKVTTESLTVDSKVEEDPEVKAIVEKYQRQMTQELGCSLGNVEVELDGRFASIRNRETNLGNFVADIMLEAMNADMSLINSGTFRSDTLHPEGDFKKKDLLNILPLIDSIVVLKVTGMQIWQALENSVSQYPKKEGRFPQVAGMKFGFDPTGLPGQRVDPLSIIVSVEGESRLLPNKVYRFCTKDYIAKGKDGYSVLKNCEYLVDEENGPILSTIVQNHFASVKMVKGLKPCRSGHRQSLISLSKKPSFLIEASLKREENAKCTIAPEVEGRITQLNEEQVKEVASNREKFLQVARGELDESVLKLKNDDNVCEPLSESEDSEPEEVQEIIEAGTPPGSPLQPQLETTMQQVWVAVEKDDIATVIQLLNNNIDLKYLHENITILHKAASSNAVLTTFYLMEELKADPNCRDDLQKSTPLMHAVEKNQVEASAILLQFDANIDALNDLGRSALDLATEEGREQIKIMMTSQVDDRDELMSAIKQQLVDALAKVIEKEVEEEKVNEEENVVENDDLENLRSSPALLSDEESVTTDDEDLKIDRLIPSETWIDSRRGSILEVIHEEEEERHIETIYEVSKETSEQDEDRLEDTGKEDINKAGNGTNNDEVEGDGTKSETEEYKNNLKKENEDKTNEEADRNENVAEESENNNVKDQVENEDTEEKNEKEEVKEKEVKDESEEKRLENDVSNTVGEQIDEGIVVDNEDNT